MKKIICWILLLCFMITMVSNVFANDESSKKMNKLDSEFKLRDVKVKDIPQNIKPYTH